MISVYQLWCQHLGNGYGDGGDDGGNDGADDRVVLIMVMVVVMMIAVTVTVMMTVMVMMMAIVISMTICGVPTVGMTSVVSSQTFENWPRDAQIHCASHTKNATNTLR